VGNKKAERQYSIFRPEIFLLELWLVMSGDVNEIEHGIAA